MKFLRANAPRLAMPAIEQCARQHFGLTGELSPLYSERDQNVRLRESDGSAWVLKIANAEEDPAIVDCQIETLRHIARVDPSLPVPRVRLARNGTTTVRIAAENGDQHIFYVLSYLDGRIAGTANLDTALYGKIGNMVARLGRAMRGFFHPAAGTRELLWDVRMAPRLLSHVDLLQSAEHRKIARGILTRFRDEVLPRLETLRVQPIHGDVHEHNLILTQSEPAEIAGIIDFGDMIHAPLVMDLADTIADFAIDPARLDGVLTAIAGAYHAVTPLEDAEIDLLCDLVLTRLLITPLTNAVRAHETPEEPNYMAEYGAAGIEVCAAIEKMGRDAFQDRVRAACGLPTSLHGVNVDTLIARRKKTMGSRLYVFYDPPLHMVKGEGVWLTDASGRRYLDCYNNVPHVGHCHPHVVEALTRQIRTLNTNTRYLGEQVLEYSERLGATLPGKLKVCAFVNSGSEANDIAWRMAKTYTGNTGGITMDFAYHGITDAVDAFSPSGNMSNSVPPHMRVLTPPDGYRGAHRYGTPDWGRQYAADADRAIASLTQAGMKPAAFMVDSAFMTNGVLEPQPGYVVEVFRKIRAAGGLCIGDEVQSGFGRMGTHMWGHAHHDAVPDIVTIGKPAGNGHPLGVVITTPEIMEAFLKEFAFFSTFGGNNVSCAAGLAVLDVIEREGLVENARIVGDYLKAGIKGLMSKHSLIGDVRGTGLALGVELVTDRKTQAPAAAETKRLLNFMRDEGVLIGSEGIHGNVLKIRPPIVFSKENADIAVAALDRALVRI
ncbi:aminotransferase class III-fold pyridoxal phosphate-dependent enzyme [Dongia sp.]|uniref:aminotransferase class III-fold pyridoxal phosphate-dependent enzyme n=1 Tax=Dongia sp. TaxID=1977262 RepID=UPI0035B3D446